MKKSTLSKTLITIGSSLLTVLIAGGYIADDSATAINGALGIRPYRTEVIEGSENEDTQYFKSKYNNILELEEAGRKKCEEAENEGIVLLKNKNNALPLLENERKVSLFSVSSVNPVYGGTGSGNVDTSTAPTLKTALERDNTFSVNPTLWDYYKTGDGANYKATTGYTGKGVKGPKSIGEVPWSKLKSDTGASFAQHGDAAIVILSRIGGEGSDSPRPGLSLSQMDDFDGSKGDTTGGDYLKLSPKEIDMLKGLKAEKEAGTFKKIVVLLNFANQIEADFLEDEEYGIDAALWIGTPGQTGLYSVGNVLSGKVNPSGHLSTTFWADHHQNPSLSNFGVSYYEGCPDPLYSDGTPNQDRVYVVYQEGIYLGYKYTESRYEDYVIGRAKTGEYNYGDVVTYPFGYGLSYTTFEYSNFHVKKEGSGNETYYEVSVDVTNTGDVDGKEVVQVYLNRPYDGTSAKYNSTYGVEAPASELVGFKKTASLKRGQTETVKIQIDERSFASYDSKGAGTYVLTGGDYYLSLGNGAHDALNNCLAKKAAGNTKIDDANADKNLCSDAIKLSFDDHTYSTSAETNAKIGNLFDDCDYNNYEHKVEGDKVNYISRNDWEGTVTLGWDEGVVLHYNPSLQADLDKYGRQGETAIEEDDGQYPTMGASNGLQLITLRQNSEGEEIAYDDPIWDTLLDQLTWEDMVETIRAGMRCSSQIANIGKPYCVDHNGPTGLTEKYSYGENGLATTTDDPNKDDRAMCYPASGILAASYNIDLAYEVGHMISEDAIWAGYAGLYGPGSNIQRTPYSGRNYEYYSEDGYLTGIIAGYECAAMESNGLYVYNKHFALNEMEDMRRGVCTWANEQTMREIYLRAFELPIAMNGKKYTPKDGEEEITLKGASGVMVAFNRVGLYWSGLRKSLMTDFLRTECGMTGICVTDMWYGTATPYLNAPAMLLAGTNLVDGGIKATEFDACKTKHSKVAWAMRESIHRICYSALHSNAMNGISSNTIIIPVREFWRNIILGAQITAGLILLGGFIPLVLINVKKREV